MQIVIDIPEEEYQNYLKMRPAYPKGVFCYIKAIQNGTPLPKGHGRLIDANELLKMTESYKSELGRLKADPFVKSGIETVESFIKEMPTIIEADKAESEEINDI